MTGIDEVRERLQQACIAGMDTEYVDDVSALLADHARLLESNTELTAAARGLLDALRELTQFVATEAVESCNGSKCREPWCAGCFGEESAEQTASDARSALASARAAIAAAPRPS